MLLSALCYGMGLLDTTASSWLSDVAQLFAGGALGSQILAELGLNNLNIAKIYLLTTNLMLCLCPQWPGALLL